MITSYETLLIGNWMLVGVRCHLNNWMTIMMNFNQIVFRELNFLVHLPDYKVTNNSPNEVAIDGRLLRLQFVYDQSRSFELIISIGIRDPEKHQTRFVDIPMQTVLNYFKLQLRDYGTFWLFTSLSELESFIVEITKIIRTNIWPILESDENVRRKLIIKSHGEIESYNLTLKLTQLNEQVETLWKNQNYQGIINLLDTEQDNLTPVLKAKFHYALKMINSKDADHK